ncbi:MAG: hypothetical protein KAT22_03170 [Candidatus Thorarchaeota archaeon]|nr:hypothetical protein [Candidatus Thorarchaeota archaeon]
MLRKPGLNDSEDSYQKAALNSLKSKASRIIEDVKLNEARPVMLRHQVELSNEIDKLWQAVQSGSMNVDSVPMLRFMKDVGCRELKNKLNAQQLDGVKITRELNLLINTMQFVLKPKESKPRAM